MLHRSFKPAKCKTALKLAIPRIKLLNNKREAQLKQMKRELAQLLESGQVQTARIRVEHVIREEKTLTAYNFIEVYCELIATRLPIIESQKNCPIDLKEAITSVIFASPRCADIPEIMDIRKQFTAKYGKEFVSAAIELRPDCGVNRKLVENLSAKAPDGQTKLKILSAIAEEHNVKWNPDSFGEHDSKPPQDLLNGPSTFEMASKINTEAPPGPSQNHDDKGPPNIQVPSRHDEKRDVFVNFNEQTVRPTSASQNFASIDVAPNKGTGSGAFHPDVRSSGTGIERMEYKQSYSGNENDFSSGRQNWNMQFKDATSAAQAAAESAERASMAARAAAELSRQYSSESQKSYGYVSKDGGPQDYANSKLQSDHFAKDAENNTFHGRNSEMHDAHVVDKERKELAGAAERFPGDGYKNNDKYSKAASLKSTKASIDHATLVNSHQIVDRYHQQKSSESDKSYSLDEVSKKKQYNESDWTSVTQIQDSVNSEEIAYFGEKPTRKQSSCVSSRSHSGSFSDDQEDVLGKNNNDMKTERHSSTASSHSHSSTFDDACEDIVKRNDPAEDPFLHDDRSIYRNTTELKFSENTAVFDDYGADDDIDKVDLDGLNRQETSLYFSSPSRKSSTNLLADSTVLSPWRNTDEELRESTSQSHPSVFPESLKGSRVSSGQDDLPPAAFDDYDSPSSDIEEDLGKPKLVGSTDLDKFPSQKNVHSKSSEPTQSEDQIAAGSSSSEDGNVGSRRNPWLPATSVDLIPNKGRPDRRQGIKYSAVPEKKFDDGDLPSGQPPPTFRKSVLDSTVEEGPELSDTLKDAELLNESTSESAKELNFGTLTGGLRNKGNRRPSFIRKSAENSLSIRSAIEDTSSKIEQSSSSPTVRTSTDSSAGNQEPYNVKGSRKFDKKLEARTFGRHVDSDDSHLEQELQQETSSSKQPYNQKLGIELNKKPSFRASRTYFDSDNSDSDEDVPKLTPTRNARPGAGISLRTKVPSSGSVRTYSKATALSMESRTPKYRAESKSSSSSSHAIENLPEPKSMFKSSDRLGSRERHKQVEQKFPKPVPSRRSSRMENLKSSTKEQTSKFPPKVATYGVTEASREQTSKSPSKITTSGVTESSKPSVLTRETSSIDKASHVHPKLPDSDALTAYFQSLKQTRE